MELITSRKNALCAEIRKLRSDRRYRYERQLFLADGTKLVGEAVRWNADLAYLFLQEGVELPYSIPDSVPVYTVPEDLMRYLSYMDAPQGVLAVCRMWSTGMESLPESMLVLDSLQDPGNIGTILRTADALDIPVVLTDNCADPYGDKAVRASMGAVFRSHPIRLSEDALLSYCAGAGIPLVVTQLKPDAVDIRSVALGKGAVVIGNEGHGVSGNISNAADVSMIIPMSDRCESLNAASAATIVLWQMYLNRS